MNALRRIVVGVILIALASASLAQAQAMKQLPADAAAVIRINNPQALSQKLGAISEKMGLAKIQPELADGLGWALKEAGIKQGFDARREIVVGIYLPGDNADAPTVIALLPVTDYKAFIGNMKDVKAEGEVTSFKLPDDADELFAVERGGYAAISDDKGIVSRKPGGMDVGATSLKQLENNDVAVYGNVKLLGRKYVPELRKARGSVTAEIQNSLKNEPTFNQKFVPVVVALVDQAMNIGEGAMTAAEGATLGLTLSNEGVHTVLMLDFAPDSKAGQTIAKMKNVSGNLVVGLPEVSYLAYGGAVLDPSLTPKIIDDLLGPVPAELEKVGADAKPFVDLINASRASLGAVSETAFGYVMPAGEPGKQSAIQQIELYRGDARKIAESQRAIMSSAQALLKLLPKEQAGMITIDYKPGAKTVDGVALDQVSVNFKVDEKTPEGAQIAEVLSTLYGGTGMSGYMGAVDDKTYLAVMGGDEVLAAAVAAAKGRSGALGEAAVLKPVDAKLPRQRCMAYYIAVDNIVNLVGKYMNKMGMPFSVKFPTGQPPIGFTVSTEGSALLVDGQIPTDLIQNTIAVILQAAMGGGKGAGPVE